MQRDLRALFAGRREAAVEAPHRGPGRPPKRKSEPAEEVDAVLTAVSDQVSNRGELLDVRASEGRKLGRRVGDAMRRIEEALPEGAQMRMPGRKKVLQQRGPREDALRGGCYRRRLGERLPPTE